MESPSLQVVSASPNSGTSVTVKAVKIKAIPKATRPKAISPDTLDKLISGITSARDRVLVALLIDTGLRAGEVVELNKDSIIFGSRKLPDGSDQLFGAGKLFLRKSIHDRNLQIGDRAVAALTEYLTDDRADDDLPALFVRKNGTRLNSGSLVHMMYGWCDRIGIERIGPHQLRHHFAFRTNGGGGGRGDGSAADEIRRLG